MIDRPGAMILLVDDDEPKRYAVAKTLRRAGYRVEEAGTGREALRLVATRPNLVILDVKLPDMDGFEVCRRIKSDPATGSIPVLHISSTFVDIEDKVHGLESGADGYLTNVAEPLELLATIRALLRARRAEDAAQLSTRQWQTTFDTISDGVLLLDGQGQVVQVNRTLERILGRSWSDLVGQDLPSLLGAVPASEPPLFVRMIESGTRESRDVRLGDAWLRVSIDPIRDAGSVIKGGLCLVSDITSQKRLEMQLLRQAQRLQEDDRRKDEFLAMLAHELRNPLASLSNALEIVGLAEDRRDEAAEAIGIARRQIEHMGRLLEDLLDISRITRGKVELRKQRVGFGTIVAHAIETCRPLIESHGHVLSAAIPTDPIPLDGDPTRLEQIVANLLNNAAKYTEPGGQVLVSLVREGKEAVLRIRDTGIGISPELQRRIFDLFVQADHSLDRAQGGLGIGLTLVRSLVELHGGTIAVQSEGPGQGSEFIVRLPTAAGPTSLAQPGRNPPVTAPHAPFRILLVDDNPDHIRTMAKLLELRGHEVRCARDGPTAVEAASTSTLDVVLLDIGLPGMDGYQVAQRLRQRWGPDQLTLIAVSGYGGDEVRRRASQAGFDHHLVKPVVLGELERILAGHPRRQEANG